MAPIVGASLAYLGSEQWEISTYVVPSIIALIGVFLVLFL